MPYYKVKGLTTNRNKPKLIIRRKDNFTLCLFFLFFFFKLSGYYSLFLFVRKENLFWFFDFLITYLLNQADHLINTSCYSDSIIPDLRCLPASKFHSFDITQYRIILFLKFKWSTPLKRSCSSVPAGLPAGQPTVTQQLPVYTLLIWQYDGWSTSCLKIEAHFLYCGLLIHSLGWVGGWGVDRGQGR